MTNSVIDVHIHPLVPKYFDYINETGKILVDRCPFYDWSEELTFDFMKAMNIEKGFLYIGSPSINAGDDRTAAKLTREINEEMADLAGRNPGKIGYFALLSLPDVKSSVEEACYALDHLHVDGVSLVSNFNGLYMGDHVLDPLYEELNKRGAVATIHPCTPSAVPSSVLENMPRPMLEFMFDTTRMLVNMMVEGVTERYPDIKFIIPHCGGTLPYLMDRLVQTARKSGLYNGYELINHFYYDIAGGSLPRQLPLLLSLVDEDRILYGSDWGFKNVEECLAKKQQLAEADCLTAEQKEKIFYKNAKKLFQL